MKRLILIFIHCSVKFGSFFTLFDLLHLAGLIDHLAVDHGLCNDFNNLPGSYIRVLCNTMNPGLVSYFSLKIC